MNDSNTSDPIIPPMQPGSSTKKYVCPHCKRFLFNGNVQRLNMVCPHCLEMIDASDDELSGTGYSEEPKGSE